MTTNRIAAETDKALLISMRKGGEIYGFNYDAETRYCLLDAMERYASDERLSFDFDDYFLLRNVVLACQSLSIRMPTNGD